MVAASKLSTRHGLRVTCDHGFGCTTTFSRKSDMQRHKEEVHQPRKQCLYCKYNVPRIQRLQDHLREDHGIEELENYSSDFGESTERMIGDLRSTQAGSTLGALASSLTSTRTSPVSLALGTGIASYPPHYPNQCHPATTNILYNDMDVLSGLSSRDPSSYSGNGQWKDDADTTYPHFSYWHAQPTIVQGYSSQLISPFSTFNGFALDATRNPLGTLMASGSISNSAHSHAHEVLRSVEHPCYSSGENAHIQCLPSDNVSWGAGYSEASGDTSRGSSDDPFMPGSDGTEGRHDSIWDKYVE